MIQDNALRLFMEHPYLCQLSHFGISNVRVWLSGGESFWAIILLGIFLCVLIWREF